MESRHVVGEDYTFVRTATSLGIRQWCVTPRKADKPAPLRNVSELKAALKVTQLGERRKTIQRALVQFAAVP